MRTSPEHPSAYALFARPDKRFPFDDIILGLIEHCAPKYPHALGDVTELVSPGRVRHALVRRRKESGIHDAQIVQSLMSHEASAALNAFLLDCEPDDPDKLFFAKWKARKGSGVPQMQGLMEIDRSRPHPFRVYPVGHPQAGQAVMGYTRFILVVANGQGELYVDGAGVLRVRGGTDAKGFARARFEIPLYSHRNQGDKKLNDDWTDACRGILGAWIIQPGKRTEAEEIDLHLTPALRSDAIRRTIEEEGGLTPGRELALVIQRRAAQKKVFARRRGIEFIEGDLISLEDYERVK